MCGIIGIVSERDVVPLLMEALQRLEYRGYDSMGIATLQEGQIQRRRSVGKFTELAERVKQQPLSGALGMGHTRWATHGVPSEANAHPHSDGRVAVVHNGILENFQALKEALLQEGVVFESETDTEVVVHLFSRALAEGKTPEQAAAAVFPRLEGAFAVAIFCQAFPDLMIVGRRGKSPLAVGLSSKEKAVFAGSDAIALAGLADQLAYLEEGDWGVLTPGSVKLYTLGGKPIRRAFIPNPIQPDAITRQDYPHFMLKEIHEQPHVVDRVYRQFVTSNRQWRFPPFPWDAATLPRLTLTACGTAFYAGFVAKYWFETHARLSVDLDVASEFRYRCPPLPEGGLTCVVSQSGETVDTLGALEYAQAQGQQVLALVNVPSSSIDRAADLSLYTQAGPEIGVASTKAFTSQLMVLALLCLEAAEKRKTLSPQVLQAHLDALEALPAQMLPLLGEVDPLREIATTILAPAQMVLYLGRGAAFPMALEGALKLKEISYLHAEAYPAGEMKHGPIALIDEQVPVVVVAPHDTYFDKTASNIQEVAARKGKLVILTDEKGREKLKHLSASFYVLPETSSFTMPLLYALPLQLLAYYTALCLGTDVDQPRNLAKSVTVE
jgi:glutamine---fructose-6-phosphate transaminase (isomerizing)